MTKQTSITIQSLPDHVLSYLLTFTEKKDGVHFTSASVTLHHRLMKNFVRSMTFGFDEAIQLVHDTTHAKKVLDKMHNPYRQLSCFLPAEWKPSANSISSLCSLKVLECSYEVFSYSFLPSLDKVQQLMLFPNNWNNIATPTTAAPVATETDGETDDEETAIINSDDANHKMESLTVEGMKSLLNTLAEKNRHNDLQLKHLIIDTCPLTEFPYIPSLSSLEIMNSSVLTSLSGYYRNLQKLVLRNIGSNDSSTSSISNGFYMNRKSFIDVSLFDAIHDVSFYSCSAISDISALNHCHSIIIYDCENILDYSKGFTNVHNIEIIDANEDAIIELTPAMKKVESLTVMTSKQANRSILTNGHNPTTLHKLQISGYPEYTHTHPSIRCLKIERCQDLTIDTTLQRVYALTLSHVNIDSLEGLISENTKVVTLDHCNEIEDFSPLQEVSKVSILDCNGFNNVEEVNRVRHLIIRSLDKVMEIGSLEALGEYVQHLELRGKVEVDCEGLIGLENMSVIEIESFEVIENTRLEGLGNNDKIVLSISADECFEDISDILEEFSEMHDYNLSHVSNTQVVMKKRIGGLCM